MSMYIAKYIVKKVKASLISNGGSTTFISFPKQRMPLRTSERDKWSTNYMDELIQWVHDIVYST